MGWGKNLTYSTLGARAEVLMNEQGCQGRLEEVSGVFHTLHPSRADRLQRQSRNERFPSRVFLICVPRTIWSSPPSSHQDALFSGHSGFASLYLVIPFGGTHGFIAAQQKRV